MRYYIFSRITLGSYYLRESLIHILINVIITWQTISNLSYQTKIEAVKRINREFMVKTAKSL